MTTTSGAEWQLWYQDSFDRECPRRVEMAGRGLARGLVELWARHLFETVRPNGKRGFSRFNLWWQQERKSIRIVGEWAGLVRLREWVYGDRQQTSEDYVKVGDQALLTKIAQAHRNQILRGETSAEILAAAQAAEGRADFEARLARWG